MLKEKGVANALAFTSGVAYVFFYLFALFLPNWFEFFYNAQFLGAEASTLFFTGFQFNLWTLVILVVTGWVLGYVWAWAYNKFK